MAAYCFRINGSGLQESLLQVQPREKPSKSPRQTQLKAVNEEFPKYFQGLPESIDRVPI